MYETMKMTPKARSPQRSKGFLNGIKKIHIERVATIIRIFNQNFCWIVTIVIKMEMIIPISGASKIKSIVRLIPPFRDQLILLKPECAIAAPAKPPIKVCDDEDGIPYHHVSKFQEIAAIIPANTTIRS